MDMTMGSERVGHDWATELNWNTLKEALERKVSWIGNSKVKNRTEPNEEEIKTKLTKLMKQMEEK